MQPNINDLLNNAAARYIANRVNALPARVDELVVNYHTHLKTCGRRITCSRHSYLESFAICADQIMNQEEYECVKSLLA